MLVQTQTSTCGWLLHLAVMILHLKGCFLLLFFDLLFHSLESADIINVCVFGSLVDSPTRRVDPLLHSYSDYEDSVYGNHCILLVFLCILSTN